MSRLQTLLEVQREKDKDEDGNYYLCMVYDYAWNSCHRPYCSNDGSAEGTCYLHSPKTLNQLEVDLCPD